MAEIPKEEIITELEDIRQAILSLEQFMVPPLSESEARRKVDNLISAAGTGESLRSGAPGPGTRGGAGGGTRTHTPLS